MGCIFLAKLTAWMVWQRTSFTNLAMFPRIFYTPAAFFAMQIDSSVFRGTFIAHFAMAVGIRDPYITLGAIFVFIFW